MAVRIRLTRTGRKNLPSFRIAVFDGRTRRDGPALEVVGWFNPLNRDPDKGFKVEAERLQHWVNRGALMTLAVRQLLHRKAVPIPVPARTVASAPPAAAKPAEKKPAGRPSAAAAARLKSRTARLKKKKAKQVSRHAWKAKKLAAAAAAKTAAVAAAAAGGKS